MRARRHADGERPASEPFDPQGTPMKRGSGLEQWLLWITTAALAAAAIVAIAWYGDAGRAAGAGSAALVFGSIAVAVQRRAHSAGGGDT